MAELAAWLERIGLAHYADTFAEAAIDLDVLPDLSEDDLADLGVKLGDRKRLLKAIAALQHASGAADEVEAARRPLAPAAERRQLTVMFVDLVDSTGLSRRLDPEDMSAVMRAYHDRTGGVIRRWGGHVAKYLGDGVLAYFGWPQAHEDDAERAVRAGLALIRAVAGIDDGAGGKLAVRVGIATGPVVVGELIGEGVAQEQAVVGETPNLAARLQTAAPPGGVIIGATTRTLLGELFELEQLDDLQLKGFGDGPAAFRVTGEGRSESRFEATRGRHLTPLVGREHELGLLLDRWSRARDGEGQVVLLSGEAGIGKSRLIQALRERLKDEPYTSLPHYGSAHHTSSAYQPVIQHLERAAGFAREDPPQVRLDKLEALLRRSSDDLDRVVPLLAPLLGLDPGGRYARLDLTPQRRKQLTLEALAAQVEVLARERPVLAIYEDTHWFDPSTLDAISLLIERVTDLRVLVLVAFRPNFTPPWRGRGNLTHLSLTRLGLREGVAMVAAMTRGRPLPPEVEAELLARTDGIPLFVEELTKVVLESGLLDESAEGYSLKGPLPPLAIPSSLHDSLMARLDRLAPVKDVAQIASVIGREFPYGLLAAVAGRSEAELEGALDQLEAAELVYRRRLAPDASYAFKHALVQDTAYQSLLKSRRQQLHAHIAAAIERGLPMEAEQKPEVLAHHLTAGGQAARAVEYWRRAGAQAVQRSAMPEAVSHLRNGIDTLRRMPDHQARDAQEVDLQITLGGALIVAKGYAAPETGAAFARARQLADGLRDSAQLVPALYGQTLFYMDGGQHREALAVAEHLLSVAEGDVATLLAHRLIGTCNMHMGRWSTARRHHEAALRLFDSDRHGHLRFSYAQDQRVTILAHLSWSLLALGFPAQSRAQADEALRIARPLMHPHTLAFALHALCRSRQMERDEHGCRRLGAELVSVASEHGFTFHRCGGLSATGSALLAEGDPEGAEGLLREALDGYRQAHSGYLLPLVLGELASAQHARGKHQEALGSVQNGLVLVDENEERSDEAPLLTLQGQIVLSAGRDDRLRQAEEYMQRAITAARMQHARLFELRAATSLARLWAERGERQKAYDLLAPIYGWFTEGFDTRDLKDAKALLDHLA